CGVSSSQFSLSSKVVQSMNSEVTCDTEDENIQSSLSKPLHSQGDNKIMVATNTKLKQISKTKNTIVHVTDAEEKEDEEQEDKLIPGSQSDTYLESYNLLGIDKYDEDYGKEGDAEKGTDKTVDETKTEQGDHQPAEKQPARETEMKDTETEGEEMKCNKAPTEDHSTEPERAEEGPGEQEQDEQEQGGTNQYSKGPEHVTEGESALEEPNQHMQESRKHEDTEAKNPSTEDRVTNDETAIEKIIEHKVEPSAFAAEDLQICLDRPEDKGTIKDLRPLAPMSPMNDASKQGRHTKENPPTPKVFDSRVCHQE
ncbi:myb-like protein X, partial [Hoplias malabaricus]|uniref:myb-like protein X n=1 Tax=Hoplias malabaricus TaxID=27720 RepID=UPI003462F0ED